MSERDRAKERQGLLSPPGTGWIQILVCVVLVFTNSANVITLRVSRTQISGHSDDLGTGDENSAHGATGYIISTAIIMAESIKICISAFLYCREYLRGDAEDVGTARTTAESSAVSKRSVLKYPFFLFCKIFLNWKDTLQLAVPGCIYFVQNNLLVFALSKLDSVTFQISYQLKILTTALFTVLVLHRSISASKWISLSILMMGVVLVQYPASEDSSETSGETIENGLEDIAERKDKWGTAVGLLAVLAACVSSGFAGVYFEKMLQGVKSSLWLRNIQLALVGICLGLPSTLAHDWAEIAEGGFFRGYNSTVWVAVFFQACSGIAVALVIKYAGNLTKCLASAVAIIVSTLVSYYVLDDITLTPQFIVGGIVVLAAVFLYNLSWVRLCVVASVGSVC